MESITVNGDVLNEGSIAGTMLNYHDAALLELQRLQEHKLSLKGKCGYK